MKLKTLKLCLFVAALSMSACTFSTGQSSSNSSDKTSSSGQTSEGSGGKTSSGGSSGGGSSGGGSSQPGSSQPADEHFSFNQLNYTLKSGVSRSELKGAPWINSNLPGMINKIEKPSLKDDFYASINYDALCANEEGPFDRGGSVVTNQLWGLMNNSSSATNSATLIKARNLIKNGAVSQVSSYLNNININSYVNSSDLFSSSASFFDIYREGTSYYIDYNDGYFWGDVGIATMILFAKYGGGSTATYYKNMYDNVTSNLFEAFDISLSNANGAYNQEAEFCWTVYAECSSNGHNYSKYTIDGSGSYTFLDNALKDLGLTSGSSIYLSNATAAMLYEFDYYFDASPSLIKDMLLTRLAFQDRFLSSLANYRILSTYIGGDNLFSRDYNVSSYNESTAIYYMVSAMLPAMLERAYIQLYGDPTLKTQISSIIEQILNGYKSMANNLDWLDTTTRNGLLAKLNNMKYSSCYSDKIKNYSAASETGIGSWTLLDVQNAYDNMMRTVSLNGEKETEYFWSSMPCYTVNAFYSPGSNQFVILNGLLAGGFTGPTIEENLAGVGMVIGHEISHGFDKNGSQYDQYGQQVNWWSDNCKTIFNTKIDRMINFYDQINLFDATYCTGSILNTEATADMGGVRVCLEIAKGIEGFDYDLFFRTFAKTWHCQAYSNASVQSRLSDSHPFSYLRCNVTLAQFDEFVNLYGIQYGDGMYVPKAERVAVW